MEDFDVLILGAGGAGLMCAIYEGKRGRRVLVLERLRESAFQQVSALPLSR